MPPSKHSAEAIIFGCDGSLRAVPLENQLALRRAGTPEGDRNCFRVPGRISTKAPSLRFGTPTVPNLPSVVLPGVVLPCVVGARRGDGVGNDPVSVESFSCRKYSGRN